MWRKLIVAMLLVLCCVDLCQARPVPPVEGLEALRRTFAGISDLTADITQEKRLSLMKRTLTMQGVMRFRKPDLFYLEILAPYASRMVLRDTVMEQLSGSGERGRMVLPPDQGLKQWFTRLAEPITVVPEGMQVQADRTGPLYTITIRPKGAGQVRELVIAFQEDGTVKRLLIGEQNGDRTTMTFRKVRRNTGLTEKDFRLE